MTTKKENSKVELKSEKALSKLMLDKLNALNLSEKVKGTKQSNSIFKKDYQDKRLRAKYRNMLCKISKVEIDNKVEEQQNGLIPIFLLQLSKNKIDQAKETFSEISEICKKVYSAEDNFKNANDYFSANRSPETQRLLSTFIEIAQEFKK